MRYLQCLDLVDENDTHTRFGLTSEFVNSDELKKDGPYKGQLG